MGKRKRRQPKSAHEQRTRENAQEAANLALYHRASVIGTANPRATDSAHRLRISRRWESTQRVDDRWIQYIKLWLSDGTKFRCVYICSLFADSSLSINWHRRHWDDRRRDMPIARGTDNQPTLEESLAEK